MYTDYEKMKQTFTENLTNIIKGKCINHGFMTREKYQQLIDHISELKLKTTGKSPGDYQRLKRYDVIIEGDCSKLIYPVKGNNKIIKYYICNEDIFDTIHNIHISIGHGGRNRIITETNKSFKNITAESVMLYLSLCSHCQKKNKGCKKSSLVQLTQFDEMTSRGIVDLIDMQTEIAKEYNFILVYQDYQTKFLQLRPLRSNRIDEVANVLLDILTIFGAPAILQSNHNDREFTKRLIEELAAKWKELRMVHGKPVVYNSTNQGYSMDQNIKNMLIDWLEANPSRSWIDGLRFVQSLKNRAHHPDLKCSPYEAMFGVPMKIGIDTLSLPKDIVADIKEEEELDRIIEQYKSNDQMINEEEESNTTEDSIASDLSGIKVEKHDIIMENDEEDFYNDDCVSAEGSIVEGRHDETRTRKRKSLNENVETQAKRRKDHFS